MSRILTVLGARPQFIKVAPVSRALVAAGLDEAIIHTGQHFDYGMSSVFFEELGIPRPAFHLGIHGGGHGAMTGAMLEALEPLLEAERPDWVLVYGDTNSTLAGALSAVKLHIPIAHVEAGLRSFNRRMPEEVNRIITDQIADLLFTPTDAASNNLRVEGFSPHRIRQAGDVMYDAAIFFAERAAERSAVLTDNGLSKRKYILATVHRAENTENPNRLRAILKGLDAVAANLPVILPLHPRTGAALARERIKLRNIRMVDPQGYLDMVALEANAAAIATDSGGVQKEAYFHGVPCVTLRDETEWVELVELGWNRLVTADEKTIAAALAEAIGSRGKTAQPYGTADAADRIVRELGR